METAYKCFFSSGPIATVYPTHKLERLDKWLACCFVTVSSPYSPLQESCDRASSIYWEGFLYISGYSTGHYGQKAGPLLSHQEAREGKCFYTTRLCGAPGRVGVALGMSEGVVRQAGVQRKVLVMGDWCLE